MKNLYLILFSTIIYLATISSFAQNSSLQKKQTVIKSVEKHQQELIALSDSIWGFAETALMEHKSSKMLADYAEQQGFRVTRGVADLPTAFIATYGSGKPIIGVMGEYDALPGLSQKVQTTKENHTPNAAGHGCGHNMFGPGSLGAAIAIKELMEAGQLSGTIRFYGTPAEEDLAGKVYMARAGLFDDLDVCLDWHPSYENEANTQSSQAITDFTINFKGKSAHSALDPWNGRSALDAAEFFTSGINSLREHVKPSVRMHYVYKNAGQVPNVVPAEASVWLWIRDSKRSGVAAIAERMKNIAKGAALMAGVDSEVVMNNGLYEILTNDTGAKTLQKNIEIVGPIIYTEEEIKFANTIMKAYGSESKGIDGSIHPIKKKRKDPAGGSTDVGDVSYIVPEISLSATTAPAGAPWHSWVVVSCGGMSIGHKGMLFASKSLGATMVDLFEDKALIIKIREEFIRKKGKEVWKAMLPDGPAPIPNSN